MQKELTPKDEALLSLLQGQITQCRNDISTYNSNFLASSSLGAVVAALAAIFCTTSENPDTWNLFFVLPTVYFLALYNLIKYTKHQLRLGAYGMVLEKMSNQYFDVDIFQWESKLAVDKKFYILDGAAQVVFFLPVSVMMIWGFFHIHHSWLWFTVLLFMILQCALIIIMLIDLLHARTDTLKKLGYSDV